MHDSFPSAKAIGPGKSFTAPHKGPSRLNQALMNLTDRRNRLHDVALALQEKLAPVLNNAPLEKPKEPCATAPSDDSSVVTIVDAESRALQNIENLLVDLLHRLDV